MPKEKTLKTIKLKQLWKFTYDLISVDNKFFEGDEFILELETGFEEEIGVFKVDSLLTKEKPLFMLNGFNGPLTIQLDDIIIPMYDGIYVFPEKVFYKNCKKKNFLHLLKNDLLEYFNPID